MRFAVCNLNSKGMSLVELMITTAAGIVVLLAASQYMIFQTKQIKAIEQSVEGYSIQQDVTRLYSRPAVCQTFFQNRDGNVVNNLAQLTDTRGAPNGIHYQTGRTYGGRGSLRLTSIQMVPVPPASIAGKRGQFLLRLSFRRVGAMTTTPPVIVDTPVYFETNAVNRIQACNTSRINTASGVDCVTVNSQINSGSTSTIACPANFSLSGGGIKDEDICKNCPLKSGPIAPGTPGYPNGGWSCNGSSSSVMRCYAICCRPSP